MIHCNRLDENLCLGSINFKDLVDMFADLYRCYSGQRPIEFRFKANGILTKCSTTKYRPRENANHFLKIGYVSLLSFCAFLDKNQEDIEFVETGIYVLPHYKEGHRLVFLHPSKIIPTIPLC